MILVSHPLDLLTRTFGRVTFSPVAAKSATVTGTPETFERIGAFNQRLFLRPHSADVKSLSMGLCGAAFGQAGSQMPVVPNPVQFPPFSDWNQIGGEDSPTFEATIMSNITILGSAVRQFNNLYSLNDLHAAAGGESNNQPAFFLRTAQTKKLIAEITSANMQSAPVVTATSGENKGTYVCKPLVYAYAMWVSAKFHLAVINAFDALQASSSPTPNAVKSVPALAAPVTTVVTTVVPGHAPTTQTFYGEVAVLPHTSVLSLLDEVSGAMQFVADAHHRLDQARAAMAHAAGVAFDVDGSAKRRADAAREWLMNWGDEA